MSRALSASRGHAPFPHQGTMRHAPFPHHEHKVERSLQLAVTVAVDVACARTKYKSAKSMILKPHAACPMPKAQAQAQTHTPTPKQHQACAECAIQEVALWLWRGVFAVRFLLLACILLVAYWTLHLAWAIRECECGCVFCVSGLLIAFESGLH